MFAMSFLVPKEKVSIDANNQLDATAERDTTGKLEGFLLISTSPNKAISLSAADGARCSNIRHKRWFAFDQEACVLKYYRSRNDTFALDEIHLATSTLSLQTFGNAFKLCILTETKNIFLEANTPTETFLWANCLQTSRNNFIETKYQNESTQQCDTGNKIENAFDLQKLRETKFNGDFFKKLLIRNDAKLPYSNSQFYLSESHNTLQPDKSIVTTDTGQKGSKILPKIMNRLYSQGSSSGNSNNIQMDNTQGCPSCLELGQKLTTLTHDKMALDDEIKSNRDVIKILQEQLRIFNSENSLDSVESTQKIISLENQLLNLKLKYAKTEEENEKLREANKTLEARKVVMEEILESRDRTLISLTHEVYDLESKSSRQTTLEEMEKEFIQDELPKKLKQKMEQLEDKVSAYSQQNKFLNDEIVDLHQQKNVLESKKKQVESKLCEAEAKSSQIQSKLLSLLSLLNKSFQDEEKSTEGASNYTGNSEIKKLVARLLGESSLDIPLSWKPGNRPRKQQSLNTQSSLDYDELGFVNHGINNYDLVFEPAKNEMISRMKWNNFIISLPRNELTLGNAELKVLLRQGMLQEYRGKVWRMLIEARIKTLKAKLGDKYYESLLSNDLESNSGMIDPSAKQIELDLLRTLPNNRHFETLESDGIGRLRRVLIAYSRRNRSVGYCQGLNRVTAVALLFMNEEEAFWCLVAIVETIMPKDFYGRDLLGAHVDVTYVLRDLIAEKLPKLSQHMELYQIEIFGTLFAWFLTIFVDNFSVPTFLYIWDVFLHEGSKVLFRFSLAILKLYETELLLLNDSPSFNLFLRTLDEKKLNLQCLSEIAFQKLNPFSSRLIKLKRAHYTSMVRNELKKIEEVREDIEREEKAGVKDLDKEGDGNLIELESD